MEDIQYGIEIEVVAWQAQPFRFFLRLTKRWEAVQAQGQDEYSDRVEFHNSCICVVVVMQNYDKWFSFAGFYPAVEVVDRLIG